MVYLADWRHSIKEGEQVSDIEWEYNDYGPFVWDVINEAKENRNLFEVKKTTNYLGKRKTKVEKRNQVYIPKLNKGEKETIDHVIEETDSMNWEEFMKLVYSTYPVVSEDQYSKLDLPDLAREYKKSVVFED
jgi:hypothetical protein